ncbi:MULTISPECIES: antiviral reverse transcriptase Drt3b [unclassified Variovorax]|uniref:antiviral reverse transcriptase Drt3b n=1 Tax=unclassified Variovorax TaxID=663243 RepID=UPI002577D575|nr:MULTISPECIES: antiviral reverse transcriptase Drt3b [unclassified Variovorax]MDM0086484.1 antiviral reverse transcriptase Drt3b [Variovorax sp. J22G40]MDM0145259.1 antiviral reverse transcriptase Drt3b [Variovorax sp. J2P1-31]
MLGTLGLVVKKINKIKRNDYNRVLITETLPFETPIIFSNTGLYDQIADLDSASATQQLIIKSLVFGEGRSKGPNATNPYTYKIRKNSTEFRRLGLLHPISQWQLKGFYEKYEHLILHYCNISPTSIRAPRKIAGSFYSKSSWENINKYKNNSVSSTESDRYAKHTPSYFSYAGHDRLYKFFNSRDYFSLEKQFSVLRTLDVAKCFDSIYTHSLSWAVKDKAFTKASVSVSSTFAQEFDEAIRHGNYNETNGIPIGPEASRIFSEIIFQEIDRRVIQRLAHLKFGRDYTFRRYVDDVFIFTLNEDKAKEVYDAYADILVSFNLHANSAKSSTIHRPFITEKSRLIYEAGLQANTFFEKFLEAVDSESLKPKRIFSRWRISKSYIDSVKALCSHNNADYDAVASFLISVITERIKKLVNNDLKEDASQDPKAFEAAIEVLMEVMFFLYSVAPSVGASYKLSTSLILVHRFAKSNLPGAVHTISQYLYGLAETLLFDQCNRPSAESIDGFVNLEYLNIVLSMRELGEFHLLPERVLYELFIKEKRLGYFTIVACLFYVRNDPQYKAIRRSLIKAASSKMGNLSDILTNSENAYLFLDLLTCPFVPNKKKAGWIISLHQALGRAQPSASDISTYLSSTLALHTQVDWSDVDLLNSLEKKELKQAY